MLEEKEGEETAKAVHGKKNYYEILGVSKDASEKQINSAYKVLALKFHPDRNKDNEEAAHQFKLVGEAHHCLSDHQRRLQYDLGENTDEKDSIMDSLNALHSMSQTEASASGSSSTGATSLNSIGGDIGRAFGAAFSRIGGAVVPGGLLGVSPSILETAHTICTQNTLKDLPEFPMHKLVTNKADKQTGVQYQLKVTEEMASNGFIFTSTSVNKDRYKVLLFHSDGNLLHQECSAKSKDGSTTFANLFFTSFDTYFWANAPLVHGESGGADSGTSSSLNNSSHSSEVPAIFSKLDGLTLAHHNLQQGTYLLVIVGDNYMGLKATFTACIVPALAENEELLSMKASDGALLESKAELSSLKEQYLTSKAAYEKAKQAVVNASSDLDLLLDSQERSYRSYVKTCVAASMPHAATEVASELDSHDSAAAQAGGTPLNPTPKRKNSLLGAELPSIPLPTLSSAGQAVGSASSAATSAATSAAQSAVSAAGTVGGTVGAAGGWFARRLSTGVTSLQQIVTKTSTSEPSSSANPDQAAATASATDPNSSTTDAVANSIASNERNNAEPLTETADVKVVDV